MGRCNWLHLALVSAVIAVAGSLSAAEAKRDVAAEFRAAYKADNLLLADRLYKELESTSKSVPPDIVYDAATVAEKLWNTVGQRDRLLYFVKVSPEWNDRVLKATIWLCRNGEGAATAKDYARLADNTPANDELWDTGVSMAKQLRDKKRGAEFVGVMAKVLEKFGDRKDKRRSAMDQLLEVYEWAYREMPGFDYELARKLWQRYPVTDLPRWKGLWLGTEPYYYNLWIGECELQKDTGMFVGGNVINNYDRIAEFVKDKAQLANFDARMYALLPSFVKYNNGWVVYLIMRAARDRPENFPELAGAKYLEALQKYHNLFDLGSFQNLFLPLYDRKDSDKNKLAALLAEYPMLDAPNMFIRLDAEIRRTNSLKTMDAVLAKLDKTDPERAYAVRQRLASRVAGYDVGKAIAFLRDAVAVWPCDGNRDQVMSVMEQLKTADGKPDLARRNAILTELAGLSGCSWVWNACFDEGALRRWPWLKNAALKPFAEAVKNCKQSSDPLTELVRRMDTIGRGPNNAYPPAASPVIDDVVKAYPGVWPREMEPSQKARLSRIFNRYWELSWYDDNGRREYLKHMKPVYGKGSDWGKWKQMWDNCVRGNDGWGVRFQAMLHQAKVTGKTNLLINERFGTQLKTVPDFLDLDKLTPEEIGRTVEVNYNDREPQKSGFSDDLIVELIAKIWTKSAKSGYVAYFWQNNRWLRQILIDRKRTDLVAKVPWQTVVDTFEKQAAQSGGDTDSMLDFINLSDVAGKKAEFGKTYLEGIATARNPFYRTLSYMHAPTFRSGVAIGYGDYAKCLPQLVKALKEIPDDRAPELSFSWGNIWTDFSDGCNKAGVRAQMNAQAVPELRRLLDNGAMGMDGYAIHSIYAADYDNAERLTNAVAMTACATRAAAYASWDGKWLCRKVDAAKKRGDWQVVYLLANSCGTWNINEDVLSLMNKARAEAATHLPGIYPVGEKDPAYPLYVAADELARHNSERAWQLLSKSIPTFEREALKLPPDFVAWGLEQLRMARGKDDALLLKARQIATALLAQEQKLTPELAAACLYTRAESFRDQLNFEAAKLEYQTIRNNPTYSSTPYGRKAMFRNVDLMIQMGNATAAEQTIEYWLSQNDPEIQTEAHYFAAKIAFDRKDYDECIKQLKKVFELDYTHTEGRFLQGQWKLATNNEVDETDVPVGSLSDRRIIRPGQQLTVTVQDRNLSVAGGGASIPVIIKTAPGGDVEKLSLYPSSRDPSLFRGVIEVKLGKPKSGDGTLEVSGADTVTYEIDPAFVAARGLEKSAPKELTIVDDGRLQIGTGAPRTDAEETAAALTKALESGTAVNGKQFANSLRPGNPLYIAVQDRDRSLGGSNDTVSVSVKTSSGDVLNDVELSEVRPYSGVFRGQVPTSLPPPRAYASDSAAGSNPGDVINSTRDGVWTSVADRQPGKWIAVDTMASYVVSNVTISMRNPAEILSVRLSGSLGGESISLGTLPAGKVADRVGLRLQRKSDTVYRNENDIRSHFAEGAKGAPAATAVSDFVFRYDTKNCRNGVSFRFNGAFERPKDAEYLRLKIVPLNRKTRTFAGLFLSVLLDGQTVFSGAKDSLVDATAVFDCPIGVHRLEVVGAAYGANDDFEVRYIPGADAEAEDFPMAIFDAKAHPDINGFLEDAAVIRRTDKGFNATFVKPMRLRTVRWEFSSFNSPDVQASEITMTDVNGEKVLPVTSDFSDAVGNGNLEVAPGDRISVTYKDNATSSGVKRILERGIGSSFNNATIGFFAESVGNGGSRTLYSAYRFRPGNSLIVEVRDPDCDLTAEADKVNVKVTSNSGAEREMSLVEMGAPGDTVGVHSGIFQGLLRTCVSTDTNKPERVMRVTDEDVLKVVYEDRENTWPGVPTERSARISAIGKTSPKLTLFDTRVVKQLDTSPEAMKRLELIRKRPGNEGVKEVYRLVMTATPIATTNESDEADIPANVATPIPVKVNDPSRALNEGSAIVVEAAAASEIERAENEGDEPKTVKVALRVMGSLPDGFRMLKGQQSTGEARRDGSFCGDVRLQLGATDAATVLDSRGGALAVLGSDRVRIRVLGEDGEPVIERWLQLVSDGSIALMDSTWTAERNTAHVGEKFYVQVNDPDCDTSDEADQVEVAVDSTVSGNERKMVLVETLPHSGIFTGTIRPILFPPNEAIPPVVTGAVATAEELLQEDRFSVKYGDQLVFTYHDETVLPGTTQHDLCVTGSIFKGSDGSVRLFSKRFRDNDEAVQVQFRLAECLFEQAKEFRKLKQKEKSAAAIAQGKQLLEEALRNYPDSKHAAQGEYLLANLYQELATEQKTAKNEEGARPLYTEALARFSAILSTWPDSEYAPRSQYHKALCLEMLKDYVRASEEYVKMTYLYPESELVGDATIRLATYYYKEKHRYDVAAKIYANFAKRFPNHEKAARCLFMSGSCFIKQAEAIKADWEKQHGEAGPKYSPSAREKELYKEAVAAFDEMGEKYRDTVKPELRAQALYWAGDASFRRQDYSGAYLRLKRCVFEYPETEWARRARGLLLQEANSFDGLGQ